MLLAYKTRYKNRRFERLERWAVVVDEVEDVFLIHFHIHLAGYLTLTRCSRKTPAWASSSRASRSGTTAAEFNDLIRNSVHVVRYNTTV